MIAKHAHLIWTSRLIKITLHMIIALIIALIITLIIALITDRHWPFTLQDLAVVGGRSGLGNGGASESRGARCRVVRTKCGRGADDLRRPPACHIFSGGSSDRAFTLHLGVVT